MKTYTANHKKYFSALNNDKSNIVVSVGSAGCGKTYIACTSAIRKLTKKQIDKIIITRPVVSVDEDQGFLPGNINSKMSPFMKPIYDCFSEYVNKHQLKTYLDNDVIEICPLGFMRGRTFNNSIIIADEVQNATPKQMKMLLTRIGFNSKMIVTGDLTQSDIKGLNGLQDLINRSEKLFEFKDESPIELVTFEDIDILRSESVEKIIEMYKLTDPI